MYTGRGQFGQNIRHCGRRFKIKFLVHHHWSYFSPLYMLEWFNNIWTRMYVLRDTDNITVYASASFLLHFVVTTRFYNLLNVRVNFYGPALALKASLQRTYSTTALRDSCFSKQLNFGDPKNSPSFRFSSNKNVAEVL